MKAVVFDLDNTLFDHTASADPRGPALGPGLGGTPSDELIAQWFEIEERNFDRWLTGDLTHQGQRRGRLRDFLPLLGHPVPATDDEQDQIFAGFLAAYRQSWAAFPDARPALEVAHSNGWRVGVLTNGSTASRTRNWPRSGWPTWSTSSAPRSPSASASRPAGLPADLRGARRRAADTLMIGDNLDLDVLRPGRRG